MMSLREIQVAPFVISGAATPLSDPFERIINVAARAPRPLNCWKPGKITMGYLVREIQGTPNPNAVKFLLNREISDRPVSFLKPEDGADHPVASQIFEIKGVASILFLGDFVTINKKPEAAWKIITEKVEEILQKCE
jgi:hypothetical protein